MFLTAYSELPRLSTESVRLHCQQKALGLAAEKNKARLKSKKKNLSDFGIRFRIENRNPRGDTFPETLYTCVSWILLYRAEKTLNSFPPFLLLCAGGGKNFFNKTKLVTVTKTLTLRRSSAAIARHLRREDGRKIDNFTNQKRK